MDRSVPSAIFTVDDDRVRSILHDYGIQDSMDTITELFRYNFSGREVRLILKVTFKNRASMVIKLKNEKDLSREVVEQQSAFSAILERHGVPVAGPLQAHEKYTSALSDGGRGVIVKVEEFREKELPCVDLETAKKRENSSPTRTIFRRPIIVMCIFLFCLILLQGMICSAWKNLRG